MKRRGVMVPILGASILGLSGMAAADQPAVDVNARIAALEAEVARLRGAQQESWLNERRAEEVKSLVREVLADADTRASLLQEGALAGHDGRAFFMRSADNKFLLNLAGQVQFRYIANFRDKPGTSNSTSVGIVGGNPAVITTTTVNDPEESGFQLRRTKLTLSGHVGDPKFGYKVVLAADRNSNNVALEEAAISYDLIAKKLKLTIGRLKAPFIREESISSSRQLAVERSSFNEFFNVGFVEGVRVDWDAHDMVKVAVMIHDGALSGEISGAANDFANDLTDYAITGRVDVKLGPGSWGQGGEFTSWQGEKMVVLIGGAFHYEVAETGGGYTTAGPVAPNLVLTRTTNRGDDSFYMWALDGLFKVNGISLYVAGAGLHTQGSVGVADTDSYGFMVQGAYNINNQIEPFARYEYLRFDRLMVAAPRSRDLSLITVGFNWYQRKHNSKFTFDVVFALDPVDQGGSGLLAGTRSSGLGLLSDATGRDGQIVVRAQYQLLF